MDIQEILDYGVIVAGDPESGRIITWNESAKKNNMNMFQDIGGDFEELDIKNFMSKLTLDEAIQEARDWLEETDEY